LSGEWDFVARCRADGFLKARGGAHPPFFSLLAQRKEGKRKALSSLSVGSA
jgi:hypothetical protein